MSVPLGEAVKRSNQEAAVSRDRRAARVGRPEACVWESGEQKRRDGAGGS